MTTQTKTDWDAYLARAKPLAKQLWDMLSYYVKELPIPQAGLFSNGVEFAWDIGDHHLDIELYYDNHIEWFYRNRDTDECIDGECTLTCITVDILSKLYLITSKSKARSTLAAEIIGASEGKMSKEVIGEALTDMRNTSINEKWLSALAKGQDWHDDMPPAGRPTGKPVSKPLTNTPGLVRVWWSRIKSLLNYISYKD